MKTKVFANIALASNLLFNLLALSAGSLLIPHRYRSTSELVYRSSTSEKNLDYYLVDEYVDLAAGKSSIRLQSRQDSTVKIFYNEVPEADKQTLIAYDQKDMSCKSAQVFDWALAKIRSTVIKLIPTGLLTSELCDVALGPSALLLAVEKTLDEFKYLKTHFSKDKLLLIDVYERRLPKEDENKKKTLWVLVTIPSVSDKTDKEATLADIARSRQDAFIMSITVAEVGTDKLENMTDDEDMKQDDKILIKASYFRVTKLRTGSLIGQDLDEASDTDFHRDPFLKPIGIGCLSRDVNLDDTKVFVAARAQFSAQYQTRNGFTSMSYVAYDGHRHLLRLDRDGRKSVFDLSTSRSYHENQYSSFNERSEKVDERKNCITSEITDPSIVKSFMLERLIGVGLANANSAVYLGPKLVEHTSYEVYELELRWTSEIQGYNLPVLLEPAGFLTPKGAANISTRYFLTYYTVEHASRPDICVLRDNDPANQQNGDTVLLPKYIELWELRERKGLERRLINRLEFSEFNWSLDVEPNADPDSQADLSNLFNMDTCAHDRSAQSLLRFRILHDSLKSNQEIDQKLLTVFQSNRLALKEAIHEKLADVLMVPRINLVNLEVTLIRKNSLDLQVSSKAIEMSQGQHTSKFLGYIKFSDLESNYKLSIVSRHSNRHSLDMCRLDSTSASSRNAPVYCPGLTFCLLLKEETLDKLGVLEQTDRNSLARSSDPDLSLCEVYRYRWSVGPARGQSVLTRLVDNKFKLANTYLQLDFSFRDPTNQLVEHLAYRGRCAAVELKSVDAFGSEPLLAGLRYSTRAEEPGAFNMNQEFALSPTRADDRFQTCQRACQLDDYCQSFSFCRRRKGVNTQPIDCILSTQRLTANQIQSIEEAVTSSFRAGELEVRVSNERHSQTFRFKRDFDCNLHPKDAVSAFAIERAYYVSGNSGDRPQQQSQHAISSIEDCAGACYDASIWLEGNSTFTYCPLSSVCIQDGDMSIRSLDVAQTCYVYSLAHVKFYNRHHLTRLSIRLNNSSELSEKEELESFKIGRWIVGLNEQQCARDCNLQSSKCLAFDLCRLDHGFTSLCVLYSVRSPFSSKRRRLGLLPQERQFYGLGEEKKANSSVRVTGSETCSHYEIKEVYLDIRLQMILDSLLLDENSDQNGEQASLEQKLIQSDQDTSDKLIAHHLETKERALVATQLSGGSDFHLALLLTGLLLGCIGTLYASRAVVLTLDIYETFKVQRAAKRAASRSISHIELTGDLADQ